MYIFNSIRSLVRKNTGLLVCLQLALFIPFITGCAEGETLYEIDKEDALIKAEVQTGVQSEEQLLSAGSTEEQTGVSHEDTETEDKVLIVHLCGAVNNPGVYELDIDSRMIDGINKAGGFSPDASEDSLNLAMELTDGSRIYVPTKEEVKDGVGYGVTYGSENPVTDMNGGSNADTKVNINTADEQRLTTLSGIGVSRAKAIIAYREEHGGFKTVEELMNVSGIGKASFEKLKNDITI